MPGLEIRELRYERPGFSLSVDLSLPRGCFGVILGASGSGKSTTLRLVAGLLEPAAGSIVLEDRELTGLPPERRGVGLMFQDLALFPHLSVLKNIEYGPKLRGLPREEREAKARGIAASMRIGTLLERKPAALSGGEQQRVALARSLAADPLLLCLDEPLSSLDTALRRELRIELRERISERGLSALHVTHDIEEAMSLGDVIFLMDRGRILRSGSPEEIWERPGSAAAARLLGRGPLLAIRSFSPSAHGLLARTAFGDFLAAAGDPGKPCFMHFASDALRAIVAGPDGAGTPARNVLSGTVTELAFSGRSERVLLSADGERLALELPPGIKAARGQVLRLSVDPRDCSVLTEQGDQDWPSRPGITMP